MNKFGLSLAGAPVFYVTSCVLLNQEKNIQKKKQREKSNSPKKN
jgi:hypothetical protein